MGYDTEPSATAALISSLRRWYTRGVVMMYSIVVDNRLPVVSLPAAICTNVSASHCACVRP